MTQIGYRKADLNAAICMLDVHLAKLKKAAAHNKYPEACSALRAIEDECTNASQVAATLSLSSHLEDQRR